MATAFQANAFQASAFQIEAVTPPPPPATPGGAGTNYMRRVYVERQEILPQPIPRKKPRELEEAVIDEQLYEILFLSV